MKAVVIYAFALLALGHGQDEIHGQLHGEGNSRHGNPYQHLLRTETDRQIRKRICLPGSKVEGVCQRCFCSEEGSEIICVNNGSCNLPRHRRDSPSTESIRPYTDKSCIMCTCEPEGLCTMTEYDVCPLQELWH